MNLPREPLLHLFLLGAGLFVPAAVGKDVGPDRIVVTAGQIGRLTMGWERT